MTNRRVRKQLLPDEAVVARAMCSGKSKRYYAVLTTGRCLLFEQNRLTRKNTGKVLLALPLNRIESVTLHKSRGDPAFLQIVVYLKVTLPDGEIVLGAWAYFVPRLQRLGRALLEDLANQSRGSSTAAGGRWTWDHSSDGAGCPESGHVGNPIDRPGTPLAWSLQARTRPPSP